MDKTQTSPFESAQEFLVMRNLYESAVKQLALKFEVLNSEFNIQYSRSPIHHIESRVKSAQSIMAKLAKLQASVENVIYSDGEMEVLGEVPFDTAKEFQVDLRSMTDGKGIFEMEFLEYRRDRQE